MALYTFPSVQVLSSGALSNPFSITNVAWQGCPLSPPIFNLLMEPLAIYIRSHPDISGFWVKNKMHTISLFADDIILMLTDVGKSLASVHNALILFNQVSYYKVNDSQSHILDLGILKSTKKKLISSFPYVWKQTGIKYLGIIFTPQSKDLVTVNYLPFLTILNSKLHNLVKIKLTWSGRLALFKLLLLPQPLYLFRTLPIPVPNTFFLKAQALPNCYLWKGKKAKCTFSKLILTRKAGGMGHVVIRDYHRAVILTQLKAWFPSTATTLWVELERS